MSQLLLKNSVLGMPARAFLAGYSVQVLQVGALSAEKLLTSEQQRWTVVQGLCSHGCVPVLCRHPTVSRLEVISVHIATSDTTWSFLGSLSFLPCFDALNLK